MSFLDLLRDFGSGIDAATGDDPGPNFENAGRAFHNLPVARQIAAQSAAPFLPIYGSPSDNARNLGGLLKTDEEE